jgi:hypothetical protein
VASLFFTFLTLNRFNLRPIKISFLLTFMNKTYNNQWD